MSCAMLMSDTPTPANGNAIVGDVRGDAPASDEIVVIERLMKLEDRLTAFNQFLRDLIPEAEDVAG